MSGVKRLQIMIEEDLDAALEREASRQRCSKAALIRKYVRERITPLPPLEEDPLWDLIGVVQGGPNDSLRVNEIVYGDLADE